MAVAQKTPSADTKPVADFTKEQELSAYRSMYGIKDFTAVINPPQSTILAVGTGEERAVVRNGKIEAAMMMSVTLSCDHRALDGALGAELIGAFKTLIENPVMMVV